MSVREFLDRCAELHPLDAKGNSTSFARGEIDQIAYKLPDDEDFSYITAATEDDEIDQLAAHITGSRTDAPETDSIAEALKECRDALQVAADPKADWNLFALQIDRALNAANIEHRTDYSGRGMYGARCIGVDCGGRSSPSEEDVLEAVKNVKGGLAPARDSMGLGTILYWPAAQTKEGRY